MPRWKARKPSRKKIVQAVIRDHFLTEEIFFSNTKWSKVVEARRDAIDRLLADGAYEAEIADLLQRERTIVRYHLKRRGTRNEYYANKWREKMSRLRANPEEYKKYAAERQANWYKLQERLTTFKRIRKSIRQSQQVLEAAE